MKIKTILGEDFCVGCGLCEAFGNKMTFNKKGYLRPAQYTFKEERDKNIIESVCPGYFTYNKNPLEEQGHIKSSVWGNYISLQKAFSLDNQIRFGGSSGGVITALLKYAIVSNFADAVIVTLADKDNHLINRSIITEDVDEIVKAKSSRYSPSSPLALLNEAIQSKKRIILVGKPCDITAYKNLERLKPELKETIVLTIAFLCAGVPSIEGTKKIIHDFGIESDDVSLIKYRGDGCPGYFTIKTKTNEIHKLSYNDSWGKVLNKYLQKRCKICPDGTGESADIACGDIWEEENGKPVFIDKEGFSLVIIRSKLGEIFFGKAYNDGVIAIDKEIDVAQLDRIQPYQVARRKYIFARYLGILLSFKRVPKYDMKRFSKFLFVSPKRFAGVFLKTFVKSLKSQL